MYDVHMYYFRSQPRMLQRGLNEKTQIPLLFWERKTVSCSQFRVLFFRWNVPKQFSLLSRLDSSSFALLRVSK